MWLCEVIMVSDKRWVVNCGVCVCVLIDRRSLLGIPMYTLVFTLHILLTFSEAIAMLYPSGWALKTYSHINPTTISTLCECVVL